MMRSRLLRRPAVFATSLLVGLVSACATPAPSTAEGDVCDLAETFNTCPECADGDTTCTFGDTSVTRTSCNECQARGSLFQTLCDEDATLSAAAVEDGTVCQTLPLG